MPPIIGGTKVEIASANQCTTLEKSDLRAGMTSDGQAQIGDENEPL